ncbi:hypothetical protein [Methylobacterium sp. J-090]|uniref:hypothetical protein n=1 Tax=Methylobacterium sp. J-090 TaxID=2836666 RepID=UPI001FB9B340|nr:hypothetical protein [Methylobacterium sp. J-090]MCJ2080748.1 hypothetical protein [Methylobacterium sp. J-090]
MPIELPAVLKLLNGNPLMKVRQVIGEHLPLTKSLDGGAGLDGLMSKMMGGGLGSIISNPTAAIMGQLQGAIGSAADQITGAMGGNAADLVSALNGSASLGVAATNLSSAGNGLLSATGILAVVGHAGVTDMAGAALPGGLGIDTVLGPLNADAIVSGITQWVPTMVAGVIAGTLPVDIAIAQVEAHAATLNGITNASATALATVEAMAPNLAAVSTVAAALVAAPVEIRAVLERAIAPEDLATMRASVAAHSDDPQD